MLEHRNLRNNNGNNHDTSLYVPRNLDNTKLWQRYGDVETVFLTGGNEDWAAIPQASRHGGKLACGVPSGSYACVPKKDSEKVP